MLTNIDFRSHVLATIDRLDALYDADIDPLRDATAYATAAAEVGNLAARLGHAELYQRSLAFGQWAEWSAVKGFLSHCLAAVPEPVTAEKMPVGSPWLDSQQSADYLGITLRSLNGLVARGQLEPKRGPRRQYRFTREQLDAYLCQSQSLQTAAESNSR